MLRADVPVYSSVTSAGSAPPRAAMARSKSPAASTFANPRSSYTETEVTAPSACRSRAASVAASMRGGDPPCKTMRARNEGALTQAASTQKPADDSLELADDGSASGGAAESAAAHEG